MPQNTEPSPAPSPTLKLDALRECLFPHNAPHLINVSQGVEVLIIVVVEGSFQSHTIHTVRFCDEAKQFGQSQFKAVQHLQRHPKELFKISRIHLCAICSPEQVIYHSLTACKANC